MALERKSRLMLAKLALPLFPAIATTGLFAYGRMVDGVAPEDTFYGVEYGDVFAYSIFACLFLLFLALASVVTTLSRERQIR